MTGTLLEVIATSLDDALAAEEGGAGRLEIVRDLDRGGLTPELDLVERILARVRIPSRVMIREEEPFVPTSARAVAALEAQIGRFASLPVDGLVLGVLDNARRIDVGTLRRLLEHAPSRRVTFHRAFDEAPDAFDAIAALHALPAVDRILTTGGAGSWADRARRLAAWAEAAGPAITLIVSPGLDPAPLADLATGRLPVEVHVGRAARLPATNDGPVSAARVAAVVRALDSGTGQTPSSEPA
jgi:copper homeostasis protein